MSSTWVNLRNSLEGIAPSLAGALGTAVGGPLAGAALTKLSSAVLGKPDGSIDQVTQAVSTASPETLAAIKKADQEFEVHLAQLKIDLVKIRAGDRDSARSNNKDSQVPAILTTVLLLVFGTEAYVVFAGHAEGLKDSTIAVVSTLVIRETLHYLRQCMTYWFGSDDTTVVDEDAKPN